MRLTCACVKRGSSWQIFLLDTFCTRKKVKYFGINFFNTAFSHDDNCNMRVFKIFILPCFGKMCRKIISKMLKNELASNCFAHVIVIALVLLHATNMQQSNSSPITMAKCTIPTEYQIARSYCVNLPPHTRTFQFFVLLKFLRCVHGQFGTPQHNSLLFFWQTQTYKNVFYRQKAREKPRIHS